MTMICGNCNRAGIEWVGDLLNPTGTACPHCGGINCQRVDEPEDDEDDACHECDGGGFTWPDELGRVFPCENCDGTGVL